MIEIYLLFCKWPGNDLIFQSSIDVLPANIAPEVHMLRYDCLRHNCLRADGSCTVLGFCYIAFTATDLWTA